LESRPETVQRHTVEGLTTLLSLLLGLGLLAIAFGNPLNVSPQQKAKQYTKVLAYSLWQVELNQSVRGGRPLAFSRQPASGTSDLSLISKDPWGQPYRYLLKPESGILYVWSIGPNGQSESLHRSPTFEGDDLGFILDLKMRH
jgi:hypothetical protein